MGERRGQGDAGDMKGWVREVRGEMEEGLVKEMRGYMER